MHDTVVVTNGYIMHNHKRMYSMQNELSHGRKGINCKLVIQGKSHGLLAMEALANFPPTAVSRTTASGLVRVMWLVPCWTWTHAPPPSPSPRMAHGLVLPSHCMVSQWGARTWRSTRTSSPRTAGGSVLLYKAGFPLPSFSVEGEDRALCPHTSFSNTYTVQEL